MKRYASIIGLPSENLARYRELHAAVWPTVLARVRECNITNHSIYYRDGWLFSYLEYVGDDYEADMARIAQDPAMHAWWALCEPLQHPLDSRAAGEWWAPMDELFHLA